MKAQKDYQMDIKQMEKGPLEIERKFLIRIPDLDLLEQLCAKRISIVQTYLATEKNMSRRIRKQECRGEIRYRYNEKEKVSAMTRIEREHEITEEEYQELMKEAVSGAKTIRKTRYVLPAGDLCFEIDVFPEWEDRAFAEVELKSEDQSFEFPSCLTLIKEVTCDSRYTNHALAINGFVYDEI